MPGLDVDRPVTPEEIAVVRAALERVPRERWKGPASGCEHENLRVERLCRCGCDTVTFSRRNPKLPLRPLAEGIGTTKAGEMVGVAIYGTDEQATRLEIFALEDSDPDCEFRLPIPDTIRPMPPGVERGPSHM